MPKESGRQLDEVVRGVRTDKQGAKSDKNCGGVSEGKVGMRGEWARTCPTSTEKAVQSHEKQHIDRAANQDDDVTGKNP